ncbi:MULTISPECIES: ABC transporter permease [Streptomyces]|uniref:ABC transporter permease n=2 Tax=Streptomyces TaxID=1883 RepID=A0AB39SDC4_9ACTN|nr:MULTISPECIES: ABC transporter permease [unclassified Streptomyces]WSP73926.1 ABC transporter permease [Streptomyces sp. NBC_01236]WTI36512.1 ABC transporter permease [Streptomyces sp. NBC_00775]WUB29812.1 ABC transporter permease [Streptomyces sp. NBC_00589]
MLRFILRRTFGAMLILLLISAFTFFMYYAIPQDPATLACGKNCTPDALAIIHKNLGLDESIPVQYWKFLSGIFVGRDFAVGHCPAPCFGVSFRDQQMVWATIMDRFPLTLSLTIGGLIVFLIVGLGTGMIAARYRGTWLDKVFSSISLVLSSFQIYFLGPIMLGIFVYSTGWLDKPKYVPFTENPAQWFMGLLIPWVVMSVIFTANYTRMARSTMIEQLQEEHVRAARAKGMTGRYVFFRYAWRGSLIPILTILGMDLSALLGGAVVTEFTFGLAGIGRLAVDSVVGKDLPKLMGVMLFSAAFILLLNVIVDALYAVIDPRVRLS